MFSLGLTVLNGLCSWGAVLGRWLYFLFSQSPQCCEHITGCSCPQPWCLKTDSPRNGYLRSVHYAGGLRGQPWWVMMLGRGPQSSGVRRLRSPKLPVPHRPGRQCVPGAHDVGGDRRRRDWRQRFCPERVPNPS